MKEGEVKLQELAMDRSRPCCAGRYSYSSTFSTEAEPRYFRRDSDGISGGAILRTL